MIYDENGKGWDVEIPVNNNGEFRACATKEVGELKQPKYKVLGKSGSLYKKDLSLKDKNKEGWRLISVSEECFNLYIEYLTKGVEFRYYEALRKV